MIVPRDADPGVRICSEAWAECLRESGFDVRESDLPGTSGAATSVIVEPHAALRPLADDPLRIAAVLRQAVCVSTSRLGSGALGADLPFCSAASASVALSRDAARYLSAHGAPTAHLKAGSHPRLRAPRSAARGVAVGAQARYSSYREDAARTLARRARCLLLRPAHLAQRRGGSARPSRRRRLAVVALERRRARLAACRVGAGDGVVRGGARGHERRGRGHDGGVGLRAARAGCRRRGRDGPGLRRCAAAAAGRRRAPRADARLRAGAARGAPARRHAARGGDRGGRGGRAPCSPVRRAGACRSPRSPLRRRPTWPRRSRRPTRRAPAGHGHAPAAPIASRRRAGGRRWSPPSAS